MKTNNVKCVKENINWGQLSAGVRGYESNTCEWWVNHLCGLTREGKWGALLLALTMIQEAGAMHLLHQTSCQRKAEAQKTVVRPKLLSKLIRR